MNQRRTSNCYNRLTYTIVVVDCFANLKVNAHSNYMN